MRPPEGSPASLPSASWDPAKRAAIERDLVVTLTRSTLSGSGELSSDERDWPITATLVNRGTETRWVVRPDGGSSAGWREPTIYYTAEMETTPGEWRPVPQRDDFWRCSHYATDWNRDLTEMAPGASMELDHFLDPSTLLAFPHTAAIRLYAHYEYDGGKKASSGFDRRPMPLPKELEGVPPFALVSAPLELRVSVDASLELVLVLRRRQVHVREEVPFTALVVEASVVNRTGAPIDVLDGFLEQLDGNFHLDKKYDDGGYYSQRLDGPPRQLPARSRAALLPSDPETKIVSDAPGTMSLRLRYDGSWPRSAGGSSLRRFRSPWVEVEVVP